MRATHEPYLNMQNLDNYCKTSEPHANAIKGAPFRRARRLSLLVIGLGVALLSGCGESDAPAGPADSAAQAEPVALIPRQALFGNPDRTRARISPDGKMLSWLAPDDGVMNVFVAPVDNPEAARPITNDRTRGIRLYFWSRSSNHVLYLQDQGGNEQHHVYAASVTGDSVRDLTPVADTVRALILGLSDRLPGRVLVGLNERDPELFDLFLYDVASGERELVLKNPGFTDFLVDNNLRPRLGIREQDTGGATVERLEEGRWLPFATLAAEDIVTFQPIGFDAADTHFYTLDSSGRDTAALLRTNLATGEQEVIASNAEADISSVIMHPETHEPLAYAANYLRQQWFALNDDMQRDLALLSEQLEGDLYIVAMANKGDTLLVAADASTRPSTYYRLERPEQALTELFVTRPELEGLPLQTMHPRRIASRDGLQLVSYLTLPPGSDADADGVPEQPVPMVLYVHGGPWARDEYGYNTVHQWLANRGYAVLSVNYRGSTGFGKGFTNAAVREFAGKMHDDLIDGVAWAVDNKIANAAQVAIMGGSYGGYATLVGLTFTPDTFACGVDIVGPSSLITLIESFPAYWGPSLANTWFKYVGNPALEEERADLANRSPITRVADIKAPLLIGQGENDPRVTKRESDQLVAAMDAKDLPVTYLNYPDEGHGFARPENRMSFFATTEGFLSQCLGGRYQSIDDDFAGSSVQVLHGAEYVPGLQAALSNKEPNNES